MIADFFFFLKRTNYLLYTGPMRNYWTIGFKLVGEVFLPKKKKKQTQKSRWSPFSMGPAMRPHFKLQPKNFQVSANFMFCPIHFNNCCWYLFWPVLKLSLCWVRTMGQTPASLLNILDHVTEHVHALLPECTSKIQVFYWNCKFENDTNK